MMPPRGARRSFRVSTRELTGEGDFGLANPFRLVGMWIMAGWMPQTRRTRPRGK